MVVTLGEQYELDGPFKAAARLHQSKYRMEVLRVPWVDFGNRLREEDGRAFLNYYDGLGVRDVKEERYPEYDAVRDADMLRSEHIPFNFFGPLRNDLKLARQILQDAFSLDCKEVLKTTIEHAPSPREDYLGDATSFDVYIKYENRQGEDAGIGIELKYTEGPYKIGPTEQKRVEDANSSYWRVARQSGTFLDPANRDLASDDVRQLWRNHLLGLAMVAKGDLAEFHSLTLYPSGNPHCRAAIPKYQAMLVESAQNTVRGITFEDFIGGIIPKGEIGRWKEYLSARYLF